MKTTRAARGAASRRWRALAASMLLVGVALTSAGCVTVHSSEGGFLMGGRVHVEKGDVAKKDIVMMRGSVRIDGEARRDVVVIGGSVVVNGVANDVVCIGGTMRLGPDARVRGDVVNVGGSLNRSPGAQIDGEVVNVGISWFDGIPGMGNLNMGFGRWWQLSPFHVMTRTTQFMYWLLLALLTVALVGDRVSSSAHSIRREPVRLAAIGIVGVFAMMMMVVLLFILSFLLIGIPFLIALLLGWWLAYIFGMVAVFQVLGQKVTALLGKSDASQIGLVLAGAVVLGFLHFFPWIGSVLWSIAAFVGIGAVFATRFGTNRPWMGGSSPAVPPIPPVPPAPPVPTAAEG